MTTVRNPSFIDEKSADKTILIVEDDEGIRLLLKDLLAFETPYQSVFTITGAEAVDAIEEINPCLFVLNYNLPDTNGLVLYDRLHAIPRLQKVPALLMSASIPDQVMDEIKRRNITFLQKPFDIIDLLHLIEKLAG